MRPCREVPRWSQINRILRLPQESQDHRPTIEICGQGSLVVLNFFLLIQPFLKSILSQSTDFKTG